MKHTITQGNREYIQEDYVHSANSLFHFMKESEYLTTALKKKALCPRYCKEDVAYLNIKNGENTFNEVAILQKCFCDIPLSTVIKKFPVILTDNNDYLTEEQIKAVPEELSHPDFYGKYAIAFTKRWGEKNKLQAIHYLNPEAICAENYSETLRSILAEADVPEIVANTLLDWICFFKPLRGTMKRNQLIGEPKKAFEIEIFKNFHDEHEWRYVPSKAEINGQTIQCIIANKYILNSENMLGEMNTRLEDMKYRPTWLPFQYEDIRYIIVPDNQSRIDVINTINALDDSLFTEVEGDTKLQRGILISKILVLDGIVKDL